MAASKAEKATETEGAAKKKGGTPKGQPRPSALVKDLDFGSSIDESRFAAPDQRRSQWDGVLDQVYTATVEGLVPRGDDGALKYTKIGSYSSNQGAKAQIKAFKHRGLDATYEFRTNGMDLFVRVIETA